MSTPRFHISRQPWRDSVDLFLRIEEADGTSAFALPAQIAVRKPEDIGIPIEPLLKLYNPQGDAAMQSLMDELWREGYRPKDIGTAGHLAATQAHLNDFRAIVEKTLSVKLP